MNKIKLLIIIMLFAVASSVMGQVNDVYDKTKMYDYILEADQILSECKDYESYKSVYQELISGYSAMGANLVVDYLRRLPHLEYLEANSDQVNEMMNIAEFYNRAKIGCKAADIQCLTINDKEFDLNQIRTKYTIVLFWSYSCPHCRSLIYELADLVEDYNDIALVTVNVSGDLKQVKRLLKKAGLKNGNNICDGKGWDSQIVDNYAVDMTPSMFLLDEEKIIIAKPFDVDDIVNSIEL